MNILKQHVATQDLPVVKAAQLVQATVWNKHSIAGQLGIPDRMVPADDQGACVYMALAAMRQLIDQGVPTDRVRMGILANMDEEGRFFPFELDGDDWQHHAFVIVDQSSDNGGDFAVIDYDYTIPKSFADAQSAAQSYLEIMETGDADAIPVVILLNYDAANEPEIVEGKLNLRHLAKQNKLIYLD